MMVPSGWNSGVFADGIELISGQHVEAKFVNNQGTGSPYLTGPADFPYGKILVSKFTDFGKKHCQIGDLLITVKGSGTGKVIEADNCYAISRQLMAIRPIKFDPKFCYYNLIASISRYEEAASGLIPGISREDVLLTPIKYPPLPEQRKIAKILSCWDKSIATIEKLIAASKQQKKALMQQLLTGKKRFAGFEDEWEELRLFDLTLKVGSGSTPRGGSAVYSDKGIPLIRSQNVLWGKLDLSDVVYINDTLHKKMKNSSVLKNDVLLNITGASIGRVSTSLLDEANVNQHVCIIRCNEKLSPDFLKYVLLSFVGQKQIEQFQAGGNRQGLNFEQIKSIKVSLPSLPEQQKIASVLTAADKEIELLEQKLSHLKNEKKALMQQLLTGKRRVFSLSS